MFEGHKKYLRFRYRCILYQFKALPFGLTSAPYVFTKLGKPILNYLRKKGIRVVVYLDDFLIFGVSRQECIDNTKQLMDLLAFLGLRVNF